jgi:hypothetical protein
MEPQPAFELHSQQSNIMTTAEHIQKLKREIAAAEIELDRLKKLPPVNVRRILMQAAARGLRGESPPPAARVKAV